MTKKSADINYISKDLFPKTYNRTMTDDDYIKQLEQENKQLKEVIDKANKYLHTRGIRRWSNGTHYRGLDGLQAQVLENILEEVSE